MNDSAGIDRLPAWQVNCPDPGIWALFTAGARADAGGAFSPGAHPDQQCGQLQSNRMQLLRALPAQMPGTIQLVRQVHGARVVMVPGEPLGSEVAPGWWLGPEADGAVARGSAICLAIVVADCLPVYLVDRNNRAFGLIHAGWRGLTAGVVERTLETMMCRWQTDPAHCVAFFGPSIEREAYEVDEPVVRALRGWAAWWTEVVYPASAGRVRLDLPAAAMTRLVECGVPREAILPHPRGTYFSGGEFHSHRRTGKGAGRCAALLWVDG